jgi:hypothetical protein
VRSTLRVAHNVRLAAILAVGAFVLHQLRYLIAGGSSPAELAGHGYMTELMAPIAALVLAAVLATLIRGTEGASPTRASLGRRTAIFGGALLAIHLGQESLEAALAAGHFAGAAATLTGVLVAVPLALAIGGFSAVAARALEAIERVIAVVHAASRRSRPPAVHGRALAAPGPRLPSNPLAFGLARRPPPPAPA